MPNWLRVLFGLGAREAAPIIRAEAPAAIGAFERAVAPAAAQGAAGGININITTPAATAASSEVAAATAALQNATNAAERSAATAALERATATLERATAAAAERVAAAPAAAQPGFFRRWWNRITTTTTLGVAGSGAAYGTYRGYDYLSGQSALRHRIAEGLDRSRSTGQPLRTILSPEDLQAHLDSLNLVEKFAYYTGDFFSNPNSFGVGSLVGAGVLGAVGAFAGGAWLAIPLALAGGLAPAVFNYMSATAGSNINIQAHGHRDASLNNGDPSQARAAGDFITFRNPGDTDQRPVTVYISGGAITHAWRGTYDGPGAGNANWVNSRLTTPIPLGVDSAIATALSSVPSNAPLPPAMSNALAATLRTINPGQAGQGGFAGTVPAAAGGARPDEVSLAAPTPTAQDAVSPLLQGVQNLMASVATGTPVSPLNTPHRTQQITTGPAANTPTGGTGVA